MATILVVDDHPTNREFLVTLLSYQGHRLLEAADGVAALEIVRAQHPDLVIADLVMPTMDGYEFVRQLRAEPALAQTRVMFCTATYLQSEAWALAQASGVQHLLTKPAEPEVVLRAVAEALALPSPQPPATGSEEFLREHLQVLTNKLFSQVEALQHEVAERARLERLLQQERDLLEVTLTSIGDAVMATDLQGRLTFLNPVAETLTGWTAQQAKGRPLEEVFHCVHEETRQLAESPVERVLRAGKRVVWEEKMVLQAADGRQIPIASSGAVIRSKSGQAHGVVVVFRDITERRQTEAALIRATEAAEAATQIKSEFLASMSHEMRTPLHIVLGYLELLRAGDFGEFPAQQEDVLRRIDQHTRVLNELVSMLLDVHRLEAGRLPVEIKAVRLPEFFDEVRAETREWEQKAGLPCVWAIAPQLPPLYTDPGKLKVVLKNLLSNALKFTNEGSVTVDVRPKQGGIEMSVTDTGIGIPAEAHEVIFELFRQVDSSDTRLYSGSGLGLYIAKRLLDILGGSITVESEVGRGSTFRVWVPNSPPESGEP
jgi:PAS domain S-box-containing protein